MENYICINGKKAELTEEQMKALGIELPKANPFKRVEHYKNFYCINEFGEVYETYDAGTCHLRSSDDIRFDTANYCTDKSLMEQRALHEILNRLLWRYSMEHGGRNINWQDRHTNKYVIVYNHDEQKYELGNNQFLNQVGAVYFNTREVANKAIEEIIKPFMEAHPDFKF